MQAEHLVGGISVEIVIFTFPVAASISLGEQMTGLQKLVGRFEGYGMITDLRNATAHLAIHYRFDEWKEYGSTRATITHIRGLIESPDRQAILKMWQEQREMQLQTEQCTLTIYLLNPSGEFIVVG